MMLLQLSLRMLRRHLRAGELTLLGLALALAVAGLSSVSFFTDRLGRALSREANQMLGGDVMLSADHAWAPGFSLEAGRRGLSQAESLLFTSMAGLGPAVQMAGVKAVSPNYPLRGVPRIRRQLDGPEAPAPGGPAPGSVWLDERLAATLSARPGDVVSLGGMTGTVENSAASRAAPSLGCRITMASAYPLTTRIVSARVSPFAMEHASTLPTEMDVPPRRAMADSKDIRVRVLGSKKRTARILPTNRN